VLFSRKDYEVDLVHVRYTVARDLLARAPS
jgi:hypothetical protein